MGLKHVSKITVMFHGRFYNVDISKIIQKPEVDLT